MEVKKRAEIASAETLIALYQSGNAMSDAIAGCTGDTIADRKQLVLATTILAQRAIQLLSMAEEYQATPYLRQAVAVMNAEECGKTGPDNRAAMNLLRMALVLLDRDGECEAAGDVECALGRLGEPFPVLSDVEASARIDWWTSRKRVRNAVYQPPHIKK